MVKLVSWMPGGEVSGNILTDTVVKPESDSVLWQK